MLRAVTRLSAPSLRLAASQSCAIAARPQPFVPRRTIVHEVVDDTELRTLIEESGDKLVIVDWSAKWCGPCKQIAPIYTQLSDKHPEVVFIKADIDILQEASVEAGVQSVPTFHFIKNHELVAEFAGADQGKLKTFIDTHA